MDELINPIINDDILIEAIKKHNEDKYLCVIPVGDLAKNSPVIRQYQFVGIINWDFNTDDLDDNKKIFFRGIEMTRGFLGDLIEEYASVPIDIAPSHLSDFNVKRFLYNYNEHVVHEVRTRLAERGYAIGLHGLFKRENNTKVIVDINSDIFRLADMDFIHPEEQWNPHFVKVVEGEEEN